MRVTRAELSELFGFFQERIERTLLPIGVGMLTMSLACGNPNAESEKVTTVNQQKEAPASTTTQPEPGVYVVVGDEVCQGDLNGTVVVDSNTREWSHQIGDEVYSGTLQPDQEIESQAEANALFCATGD